MLRIINAALVLAQALICSTAFPTSEFFLDRRAITQDLMDQFVRFTKLSFAADVLLPCNSPLGLTVVKTVRTRWASP